MPIQKALSMLTKEEMQTWWQPIWADIRGASTRSGHPAPYPVALAERLIRMFSFAGDTVLDPFAGTCATAAAAYRAGRHSISNEIDPTYARIGLTNLEAATKDRPLFGSAHGRIVIDWAAAKTKKIRPKKVRNRKSTRRRQGWLTSY
jgi:site-specific DNA-methyltransferase (adenine-specific)